MKTTAKPKPTTRRDTLTAIEAGAFSERYVIYNRKSTDEADSQSGQLLRMTEPGQCGQFHGDHVGGKTSTKAGGQSAKNFRVRQ